MTLRPSFVVGKRKNIDIKEQFTDKEIPREVFARKLDEIFYKNKPERKYRAIMYYGVGELENLVYKRNLI